MHARMQLKLGAFVLANGTIVRADSNPIERGFMAENEFKGAEDWGCGYRPHVQLPGYLGQVQQRVAQVEDAQHQHTCTAMFPGTSAMDDASHLYTGPQVVVKGSWNIPLLVLLVQAHTGLTME